MQENNIENPGFVKTIEYLKKRFTELDNNYKLPDNKHAESCLNIAVEVAGLLISEGGKPYIIAIDGKKIDSINTEAISPARYEGKVEWGRHLVCANDGIVYDPMIGEPVALEEYVQSAFTKPVDATVRVAQDAMEEFLSR